MCEKRNDSGGPRETKANFESSRTRPIFPQNKMPEHGSPANSGRTWLHSGRENLTGPAKADSPFQSHHTGWGFFLLAAPASHLPFSPRENVCMLSAVPAPPKKRTPQKRHLKTHEQAASQPASQPGQPSKHSIKHIVHERRTCLGPYKASKRIQP